MTQRRERERQLARVMDFQKREEGRGGGVLIPVDGSTGVGFSLQENPITQSLLIDDDDLDPLGEARLKPSIPPASERPDLGARLEAAERAEREAARAAPRTGAAPIGGSVRLGPGSRRSSAVALWVAGTAFAIAAAAAAAYFLGFFG
jgi:hypothetical protein